METSHQAPEEYVMELFYYLHHYLIHSFIDRLPQNQHVLLLLVLFSVGYRMDLQNQTDDWPILQGLRKSSLGPFRNFHSYAALICKLYHNDLLRLYY